MAQKTTADNKLGETLQLINQIGGNVSFGELRLYNKALNGIREGTTSSSVSILKDYGYIREIEGLELEISNDSKWRADDDPEPPFSVTPVKDGRRLILTPLGVQTLQSEDYIPHPSR